MAGPDLSWITGMLAGLAGSGTMNRIWSEIQSYVSDLGANAASKWGMHIINPEECGYCKRQSFGYCDGCSEPACLHHAMVSREADLLCMRCVRNAIAGRPAKKRPKPKTGRGPKPQEARVPHDPERLAALRELGLSANASWDDVRERFRELTAKWHPDRAKPAEREEHERRFKRMTAAYEVLKQRVAA